MPWTPTPKPGLISHLDGGPVLVLRSLDTLGSWRQAWEIAEDLELTAWPGRILSVAGVLRHWRDVGCVVSRMHIETHTENDYAQGSYLEWRITHLGRKAAWS